MNVFYEENGQFKVASIIKENDASYQIDTQHGKRAKIKSSHVFFEFSSDLNALLTQANSLADDIDIDFLWEVCPSDEFSAQSIAEEYFGQSPTHIELAAVLIKLYAAPMYFYKKNKGYFKAAPIETLKAALSAIKRKEHEETQIKLWANELINGLLPPEIATDLMSILHLPDKQSLSYRAFNLACTQTKQPPIMLAQSVGGITSTANYLMAGFVLQNFPQGVGFPPIQAPEIPNNFSLSNVQAFSIDDISTTEIDDALSVTTLANGNKQVGIHITVPSLSIEKDSDIENIILSRLSTVYFPGGKITMLPESWINAFTLKAGNTYPVLSLYIEIDEDFQIQNHHSKVDQITINTNLRLHEIEPFFNQSTLLTPENLENFPFKEELYYLYLLAVNFKKQRGKYNPNSPIQYDYAIEVDADEYVSINRRERDTPLDLLISEMMIFANSTWAKMINEQSFPALYRVQSTGKVRLSTKPEPHIGMGVAQYSWCTSPLRRATDYINQCQILAALDLKPARYLEGDSMLFAALRSFESTYALYQDFQKKMEHFWCLRYFEQEHSTELTALCLKEDLVRIDNLPLLTRVSGLPEGCQNSKVSLKIQHIDTLTQTLSLSFIRTLEHAPLQILDNNNKMPL